MGDLTNAIRGDASRIRTMTKIDLSCGHARAWEGTSGTIVPGTVWGCADHGNVVVIGVDMAIDGTARDAWAWIAERTGLPGPGTIEEGTES